MNAFRPQSQSRPSNRNGASSVELALVLPIMFMLLMGSIEFARAKQVTNAAAFSAYQGCRSAIIPGGSASAAATAAQQVLTANSIGSSTITVSPSTISDSTDTVTVSVAVSLNNVGWITTFFTSGKTVTRTCTLTRQKTS